MKKIAISFILILCGSMIFGQTEKIINPADLKQQTIVTEPLSLQKGFLRVGLFYYYSVLDKYFTESGKKDYLPESIWGISTNTQFWIQYGISDRLMVELGIPFSNDKTNVHRESFVPEADTMVTQNQSTRGRGLGDVLASATYQIIPSANNKFSLKGSLDITLPTGQKNPKNFINSYDYDAPTGEGVFCIMPKITARVISYPFSYVTYVSYTYNFRGKRILQPSDTFETGFKYGNIFYLGTSVNFHLNEWIAFTNDFSYMYTGKGKIDGVPSSSLTARWIAQYEPKLVFQIRRFRLGEAVQIPLIGKGGVSADPFYLLMTQYVF